MQKNLSIYDINNVHCVVFQETGLNIVLTVFKDILLFTLLLECFNPSLIITYEPEVSNPWVHIWLGHLHALKIGFDLLFFPLL